MTHYLTGAAILGGVFSTDRKTFGQFMISRPIVIVPAFGAFLAAKEDWIVFLLLGAAFELMFLKSAPYGASVPENETLAAIFCGALAAASQFQHAPLLALALALPVALVGKAAETWWERRNVQFADQISAVPFVAPLLVGIVAGVTGAAIGHALPDSAPRQLLSTMQHDYFLTLVVIGLAARAVSAKAL